ncbi:ABC transporter permease [Halobium palmae]|uniref:ABC transporter permease n=1 Tax=Halobium palmae TaxID=1776492 RepID=A0ABD5RWA4_9EURY
MSLNDYKDSYIAQNIRDGINLYLSDEVTAVSLVIFICILGLGILGPLIAPYNPDTLHTINGELARSHPPTTAHLLGTTSRGADVLSRMLVGARPTLITGLLGGTVIISIGLTVGVMSGYYGGVVGGLLMRITDFFYGIPLIPTAIILVAFFGVGFWQTIVIIGFLLWRGNARVFRSQVIQIRQRPYVESARALGASDLYIITRHILPNMAGMIVLFFALGIGISILISASLAFLGVIDPFTPSWGIILRNAYDSGSMTEAWWWTLPPGLMISLTVLSTYLLGRGYERVQQVRGGEVVIQ